MLTVLAVAVDTCAGRDEQYHDGAKSAALNARIHRAGGESFERPAELLRFRLNLPLVHMRTLPVFILCCSFGARSPPRAPPRVHTQLSTWCMQV